MLSAKSCATLSAPWRAEIENYQSAWGGDFVTVLITGGMGFIGLHTAKAFVDAGEDVVITWFQTWREPDFI